MENLINTIARTEIKEWLSPNHPIIDRLEKRIENDFKLYDKIPPCCKTARTEIGKRISENVIKIAEYGVNYKAVEYALRFDNK